MQYVIYILFLCYISLSLRMSHIVLHCGCRITATLHNKQRDSLGCGCDGSQSPLSARKRDRGDVDVFEGVVNFQNLRDKGPPEGNSSRG